MDKGRKEISLTIMKDLMLSVLFDSEFCEKNTGGHSFINKRGGHHDNLFRLVELKAIENGLIKNKKKIKLDQAWGAGIGNWFVDHNTNFTANEIEKVWESFYFLLNSNVIGPGEYGTSSYLPTFHLSEYGRKCAEEGKKDILPYDIDGYLEKLNSIDNLYDWVVFYIKEALKCYNTSAYNASVIMLGLASEYLLEKLFEKFSQLLGRNNNYRLNYCINTSLKEHFDNQIKSQRTISGKFIKFEKIFNSTTNLEEDIKKCFDKSSRQVFINYVRVMRNDTAHPAGIKIEDTEALLLFISFIKYCELIMKLINTMDNYIRTGI